MLEPSCHLGLLAAVQNLEGATRDWLPRFLQPGGLIRSRGVLRSEVVVDGRIHDVEAWELSESLFAHHLLLHGE